MGKKSGQNINIAWFEQISSKVVKHWEIFVYLAQ